MNYREQCLGVVKYLNDKFGPVLWLPELGATPNKATMIQINKINIIIMKLNQDTKNPTDMPKLKARLSGRKLMGNIFAYRKLKKGMNGYFQGRVSQLKNWTVQIFQ